MLRTLFPFSALVLALNTPAQVQDHRACGAHTITKRHLEQRGLSTDLLRALPSVQGEARGGTTTIPVVVHVVYNTSAENIPTSTINALINELNQDFSASNGDIGSVRSQFTGSIGNAGLQFCLAQVTPSGAATTGIVRVQTSDTWFDPDNETDNMKFAGTGSPAWDPTRYLNIWICDITSGATGSTVTVGYAYLPVGGVVGTSIDGLVIDSDYGTQIGARTATHEIGHYFGLLHPFDEDGNCVNSDGFSDTPTSNSPTFSCSNTNLMKCGALTQYENFMDYSNCTVMFTNQQSAYMSNVLHNTRAGLLSNQACSGPVTGLCIPTSAGGTADGDYINRVAVGSINNNNTGGTTAPPYTDYSSTHSTSLTRGTEYVLTVQGGTYNNDNVAAWIDYDQDDVFEAGEKLGEVIIDQANQTVMIPFTVPAGATLGNTTLRVRNVYHNQNEPVPTDPCFSYSYGETEDYGITVINSNPVGLCIPTSAGGTADGDYINRVAVGSINNNNTGGTTAPPYTDYSSTHFTSLTRGTEYVLTVQGGTYNNDNVAAWIDYDQDDVFEAGEKLGEVIIDQANQTVMIPFTVPAGATLGNTTLRVRNVYHNQNEPVPTDPCFSYSYGETEDYGITIVNAGSTGVCIPTSATGTADGDYINSVVFNTIENLGSGGTSAPAYTDFSSAFATSVVRGGVYIIAIEGGTYQSDNYVAWIDYDHNGTFTETEKIAEFTTTEPSGSAAFLVVVPNTATLGNTTLRVRGVYQGSAEPYPIDPCYSYTYGETEDYRVTILAAPSDYCTPSSFQGPSDGDFINGVELEGINNQNTGSTNGPTYTDYSGTHNTSLQRDGGYVLTIRSGDYAPDRFAAWIDYDQNDVFDDSEKLGEFSTSTPGEEQEIDFTVPENAAVGTTRMRVRGVYVGQNEPDPLNACFPYGFGETEDYRIIIEFGTGVSTLDERAFGLYPNPARTSVTIELPSASGSRVELLDIQGRLLRVFTAITQRPVLDLHDVAPGTYLIRVEHEGGTFVDRLEVIR